MKNSALITGASGGIGYELAKIHASKGGDLILVARNLEKLNQLKNEIENSFHSNVIVIAKDLSIAAEVDELFQEVNNLGIQIDILINNAGFGDFGFFATADWNKTAEIIDLNIRSLTHVTRLFLPGMIKQGSGRIMNVASTAAFQPGPLMAVYYASKAYVLSFSQALYNEVASHGITVTALCPGPTYTGFKKAAGLNDSMLFKRTKVATALDVANYGYRAMTKGKMIAVHGFTNSVIASAGKFFPRKFVLKMVRKLQEKTKQLI